MCCFLIFIYGITLRVIHKVRTPLKTLFLNPLPRLLYTPACFYVTPSPPHQFAYLGTFYHEISTPPPHFYKPNISFTFSFKKMCRTFAFIYARFWGLDTIFWFVDFKPTSLRKLDIYSTKSEVCGKDSRFLSNIYLSCWVTWAS